MQVQAEVLGTDLATLNTVHVKYRGFFVERFVCCAAPLREVCCTGCTARCRQTYFAPEPAWHLRFRHLRAAIMQYVVKACVRGFSEIPTDTEFENGDLSLVMDDFNPGRGCACLPGYFKRLTVNAKVNKPQATAPLVSAICSNICGLCYVQLLSKLLSKAILCLDIFTLLLAKGR